MNEDRSHAAPEKALPGIAPAVIRERMEKSKILRRIIADTEVSLADLAQALRVDSSVLETWAEGLDRVPNPTFLVMQQAYDRWGELTRDDEGGWADFCPIVARYASAARLAGFRT